MPEVKGVIGTDLVNNTQFIFIEREYIIPVRRVRIVSIGM